jgi:hypothetical protein
VAAAASRAYRGQTRSSFVINKQPRIDGYRIELVVACFMEPNVGADKDDLPFAKLRSSALQLIVLSFELLLRLGSDGRFSIMRATAFANCSRKAAKSSLNGTANCQPAVTKTSRSAGPSDRGVTRPGGAFGGRLPFFGGR